MKELTAAMVTDRQLAIVREIARYGVMSAEALSHLAYDGVEASARKMLGRLARQRLVRDATHPIGGRRFYGLTPRVAALLGVSENLARPLGAQALRDRYGMLAFCALCDHCPGERPVRLIRVELEAMRPGLLAVPGIDPARHHYYVEQGRLARAVVDHDATVERTVRKCQEIYVRWWEQPALRPLLDDFLMLTVLTPSTPKRDRIRELLRVSGTPFLVRVVALPALSHVPIRRGLDSPEGEYE
jgi:hypothetical protein